MNEEREQTERDGSEQALTKEEILARSRTENEKAGDERERERWKWVPYVGYLAMIVTVFVLMLCFVFLHKGEEFTTPLLVLMGTGMSAQIICQAVIMKRGRSKTISVVCAVLITAATVALWVLFALSLAGI